MTLIPLTDCSTMLGIDPKTLRQWLRHADMPLVAHPTDARLKCLTQAQVQQLATLHGRPLPSPPSALPAPPSAQRQVPPSQHCAATVAQAAGSLPGSAGTEADLGAVVASLARSVTTLQEQLSHLTLELLHARELRYEQRLSALETLVHQPATPCPLPQGVQSTHRGDGPSVTARPERRLVPAELKARSRVTPLIEYGAQGLYVAVCPHEGVLPFAVESSDWFEWLATLTSFRFVGPPGRFSACRTSDGGQHTRRWVARRWVHGHDFWHYLGVTDHLTLASLEQAAAVLQARVDAL